MTNNKRIISFILSLVLVFSVFSSALSVHTFAAGNPALSAEAKTVSAGEQFTVTVSLANATMVYGGNFTLQYDSSLLTVDSYTFSSSVSGHTKNCNLDYQSAGNLIRVTFSGASALTSNGALVTFTFTAKENVSGSAALKFNAYKMYDENGTSITSSANGSTITVASETVISPSISISDKTINVGETVSVPVVISNSDDVYGGNFTLQYDSSLLTVESYSFGNIISGHTKNCNLDYQSAGNLIRFTFSGSETVSSDGTLVTFTFTAKAEGTAELKFNAYKMYDENGSSIITTISNGNVVIEEDDTDTIKPTGSITSTNSVASSQTVTLKLSDNVGVAGYYWGTSSTYSNNTYTSTSSSSVTKPISSSGTYYLVVKDTSGNVSSSYSITFYKTTLDANGGSVSPSYIITKNGNTVTLPTPTKSEATFVGWATSSTASSGVKSITPTSNKTYYAVWEEDEPAVSPTISITSKTVNVGETISVPVIISNSDDVYGGNFTLQYDSSLLTVESYSFGNIISRHTKNCNLNYQSAGNLIRFTFSGSEAVSSDGTLVTFTFTAKAEGTAELNFNSCQMYDENGKAIGTYSTNSNIVINSIEPNIKWISISSHPYKLVYLIGETLDTHDLEICVYYDDETTSYITSGFTISGFNSYKEGLQTITISYKGKTTSYNIRVDKDGIFTIKFDANGGKNAPAPITYKDDVWFDIPAQIPTREGYVFGGWADSPTSDYVELTPGSSSCMSAAYYGDFTVYAIWSKICPSGHTPSGWITDPSTGEKYKECTVCGEILETQTVTISAPKITSCYNEVDGVQIKWSEVDGAYWYNVYRKLPSQTNWTLIFTTTWHDSYLDEDVKGNTVYQYRVTARDMYRNESLFSAQRECRFIETPTLLSRTNAVGGVTITWKKVAGATSYRIYRRGAGVNYWYYLGDFPATLDTFTDLETANYFPDDASKNALAKPKSGNYYRYTVRASYEGKDSIGKDYTIYSGFDTNGLYLKYVATPKLTSISNATNGLQIKWKSVDGGGPVEYRVYRRGAGSTYWYYLGTTTDTTWTDSGVKVANGGYYRYTVRAVAGTNGKGWYSAFDTTGLYLMRLANPTLTSAVSSSSGITVKWGAVKGTTGYYVYRKTANSGWTRIGTVGGTNNTTFLDKTAKKGTTYTYTVRAVCGNVTSAYNSGISCYDKY